VPHVYRTYRPHAALIRLEMEAPAVWLNVDTAVPCGLIVNELVANALKHGFPEGRSGSVRVEVAREEGRMLRLSVMDNGVGLPPDFELTRRYLPCTPRG
jgi:two-component sensor histidine kinase